MREAWEAEASEDEHARRALRDAAVARSRALREENEERARREQLSREAAKTADAALLEHQRAADAAAREAERARRADRRIKIIPGARARSSARNGATTTRAVDLRENARGRRRSGAGRRQTRARASTRRSGTARRGALGRITRSMTTAISARALAVVAAAHEYHLASARQRHGPTGVGGEGTVAGYHAGWSAGDVQKAGFELDGRRRVGSGVGSAGKTRSQGLQQAELTAHDGG